MVIKKSEFYRSLWKSCDEEYRGEVEALAARADQHLRRKGFQA